MTRKPIPDITDEEEARIQAGIALDPDNPELTDEQMAELRPFREVHPDLHASIKRSRGLSTKIIGPDDAAALGLSPETIALYEEAGGKDWRARIPIARITMRDIDKTRVAPISPEEVRALRERARMSQAVFASRLNLSTGYIAALERGAKHPSGPALVLLDVIRRKGIEAIL